MPELRRVLAKANHGRKTVSTEPRTKKQRVDTTPSVPPAAPTVSQREAHERTALHRSAESIASEFSDERSVLNIDDSLEMRELLALAGMSLTSTSRAPSAPVPTRPMAWPRGHDAGESWKAARARERFLALKPRFGLWDVQREGIAFIEHAERVRPLGYAGGIIADEMGIGKTLQFLSLLLKEHQAQCVATGSPYGKPTLMVVEKGLVATLRAEIAKHFDPEAFSPVAYLVGETTDARDVTPTRIGACFRLVVTTYPMLVTAYKHHTDRAHPYTAALFDTVWQRVLADEAHVASNRLSARFKALCALKARYRWAQTGTPVLNDVNSVCALLHFVGGKDAASDVPLDMTARVERVAGTAVAARSAQEQGVRIELSVKNLLYVRSVLAQIMLRRMQVSDRHVQTTRLVDFETQAERELYAHYYAKFCADSRAATRDVDETCAPDDEDDDEDTSGPETLVAESPSEREPGELDDEGDTESPALRMVSVDILHLRQLCAAPVVVRRLELPPRLLLDAGYRPEQKSVANTDARILCNALPGAPSLAYLTAARLLLAQDPVKAARLDVPNAEATIDVDMDYTDVSRASGKLWALQTYEQRQRLRAILRHVRARIVPSIGTKMRMFARHYAHEVPKDDKFIIFSDWVRVLEHAQDVLRAVQLRGLLLTGTHKPGERTSILQTLERDPTARALLGSMLVVANGLNIGCANHVTVVAQWWNPQTTKQGRYRVRRPDQTKACHDYNVVMRATVEEDVRRMSDEKEYIARVLLESDPDTCALVEELAAARRVAPEVTGASHRDMIRVLLRAGAV